MSHPVWALKGTGVGDNEMLDRERAGGFARAPVAPRSRGIDRVHH
jgi:hypothetical protein